MSSAADIVSAPAIPTDNNHKIMWQQCAILFGGREGTIIGGKTFGLPLAMSASLVTYSTLGLNPWIGLSLTFPINPDNEAIGVVERTGEHGSPRPTDGYRLAVKFPRGQYGTRIEDASPELRSRFPAVPKRLCLVEIRLDGTARVKVDALAFHHPSAKMVLRNEPIVVNVTLLDIIEQRHFLLAVKADSPIADKMMDQSKLANRVVTVWVPQRL
ncbi:hypothetical protein TOPH_02636 [Tolypocladium ophioglossoides CBS 100239]|uniref:Uncharacterized protein n=1 Tax=Tolypocladium ophioglossoides (strain CBS 100239) TaxID=1163406 RepID=A0A0L0NED6_TOLOC|nr:hypothetical protein TOPH_02636 [Tolypocladium ophioglossoides CBS 100239]